MAKKLELKCFLTERPIQKGDVILYPTLTYFEVGKVLSIGKVTVRVTCHKDRNRYYHGGAPIEHKDVNTHTDDRYIGYAGDRSYIILG